MSTPDSGDIPIDFVNGNAVMSSPPKYQHRASTDSGVDNPFRPDGELSKEVENIVITIKDGKPIVEEVIQPQANGTVTTAPPSSIHKSA
ncbi:hypothetical protein, partial [Staphylococcus aureus]|uniref:hypothetical protein n=1 Tax=Staphylococcus aureus TaxID=1280 RepID=UPI0038B2EDC1